MTIETNRLLLRSFEPEDRRNVFAGLSHPEVIKYYGIHYNSLEAAQAQMVWFEELEKNETGKWFAICSSDNQNFYGAAGLNNIKKEHKRAEIGFWLLPSYWRQGIITEALPLICTYAFRQLDVHRIEGFVESENISSKNIFKKLGFTHEGTLTDYEIKNGSFISLDVFSKFRSSPAKIITRNSKM